jgi:hypothetical protein
MSVVHDINAALQEDSYSSADVPKFFRVALEVFSEAPMIRDRVEQLIKGELSGVRGISANKEIILDFFGDGYRDVLLVMPGAETIKLNKLTRIMYDNPHYLLQNNCAALLRIEDGGHFNQSRMVSTLLDKFVHGFKLFSRKAVDLELVQWVAESAPRPNRINTVKDAAVWLQKAMQYVAKSREAKVIEGVDNLKELTLNDYKKIVVLGLSSVSASYRQEGEWLIKGDSLKIPRGSRLYMIKQWSFDGKPKVVAAYRKWIEDGEPRKATNPLLMSRGIFRSGLMSWLGIFRSVRKMEKYAEELKRRYKVVFVSPARLSELKGSVHSKRR